MPKSCCTTSAPYYPDRVTIQKDAALPGERPSFTGTQATRWPCRIYSISGDESWRGRTLEGKIEYVVEGPFLSGVNSKMRLSVTSGRGMFDGIVLNIKAARPTQANGQPRKLELYCTENTA